MSIYQSDELVLAAQNIDGWLNIFHGWLKFGIFIGWLGSSWLLLQGLEYITKECCLPSFYKCHYCTNREDRRGKYSEHDWNLENDFQSPFFGTTENFKVVMQVDFCQGQSNRKQQDS